VINPLGHSKHFAYDVGGNITQMTDENGNITQYRYSALGDITEVIDANGEHTKYTYDAMRRLSAFELKGNEPQITTYWRNTKGEVEKVISPLGDVIKYRYDQAGNVTSKRDQDGLTTHYDYTPAGRLAKISYADGKTVEFGYNALKQLTEMRDWLGTTKIEADALGRATKVTNHEGNEVSYTWNSLGKRESLGYPDGSKVDYSYDASGRLTQVKVGADTTNYIYDKMGRITQRVLPDNTSTKYEFNPLGSLIGLTHSKGSEILDRFSYIHDPVGNITQIEKHRAGIESDNGLFSYTYDRMNRLTEVVHGDSLRRYAYDSIGNRINSEIDGVNLCHNYNAKNQLISTTIQDVTTQDNMTVYRYDKRGNLRAIGEHGKQTAAFDYDARNMLTRATTSEGTTRYGYNGFRKRVGKYETLHQADGTYDLTREFCYTLDLTRPYDNLLAMCAQSAVSQNTANQNTTSQNFIWGNGLLSASTQDSTDSSFYYL